LFVKNIFARIDLVVVVYKAPFLPILSRRAHVMILIQLDEMTGKYGLLRAEGSKGRFSPFPSSTYGWCARAIISTIQPYSRPTRVFPAWTGLDVVRAPRKGRWTRLK